MTTAQAASSATLSVALVPRKAAEVPQREVHREVAAQEVVLRVAAAHVAVVIPQGNRTVVAVAPAVTRMTITHRAVEVEEEGDSFVTKPTKLAKPIFTYWEGNGTQPGCRSLPRLKSGVKTQKA